MATLSELYQKIQSFGDGLSKQSQELSHCRAGCSRCCYVDLTVFDIEANNIRNWFNALSLSEQESIKKKWQTPLSRMMNFHGEEVNSCVFLHNEECTIYDARPLICRSQGLAFKFKHEAQEYVDICPLNEEMLDVLEDKEVLNLDLLNMILSRLEQDEASGKVRSRSRLKDLQQELMK